MYCNKCGTKIPEGGRFCPNCGMDASAPIGPGFTRTNTDTANDGKGRMDIRYYESQIDTVFSSHRQQDVVNAKPFKKASAILAIAGIIPLIAGFISGYSSARYIAKNDPELYSSAVAHGLKSEMLDMDAIWLGVIFAIILFAVAIGLFVYAQKLRIKGADVPLRRTSILLANKDFDLYNNVLRERRTNQLRQNNQSAADAHAEALYPLLGTNANKDSAGSSNTYLHGQARQAQFQLLENQCYEEYQRIRNMDFANEPLRTRIETLLSSCHGDVASCARGLADGYASFGFTLV